MAHDLQADYPGMKGFSRTSLFAMRQMYTFFSSKFEFVPKCYVVVELKAGAFKPEYVGKLNYYLSTVDDLPQTSRIPKVPVE